MAAHDNLENNHLSCHGSSWDSRLAVEGQLPPQEDSKHSTIISHVSLLH